MTDFLAGVVFTLIALSFVAPHFVVRKPARDRWGRFRRRPES